MTLVTLALLVITATACVCPTGPPGPAGIPGPPGPPGPSPVVTGDTLLLGHTRFVPGNPNHEWDRTSGSYAQPPSDLSFGAHYTHLTHHELPQGVLLTEVIGRNYMGNRNGGTAAFDVMLWEVPNNGARPQLLAALVNSTEANTWVTSTTGVTAAAIVNWEKNSYLVEVVLAATATPANARFMWVAVIWGPH
jgi:hypothetical protein